MRHLMLPYLMPLDHPSKPFIDAIFANSRVVDNEQSIVDAGFSIIAITNNMVVARHPAVPGLVFKMFRDSQPYGKYGNAGWECLTHRCINLKKMRHIYDKHSLSLFKLPEKWLYIMPLNSILTNQMNQPVVLIATDMEIEEQEVTRIAWKTRITTKHLDELYIILKSGYGSTSIVNNYPYTKHGYFCSIDLEKPKRKCEMKRVKRYLSEEMKRYWNSLIHKN